MARTDERSNKALEKQRKSLTEEEAKRMNINLRGGRNVKEQEEERGVLGSSLDKAGTAGGRSARDIGAEQEQAPEATSAEGRPGGRSHH